MTLNGAFGLKTYIIGVMDINYFVLITKRHEIKK